MTDIRERTKGKSALEIKEMVLSSPILNRNLNREEIQEKISLLPTHHLEAIENEIAGEILEKYYSQQRDFKRKRTLYLDKK